jgi:hypothetical protein
MRASSTIGQKTPAAMSLAARGNVVIVSGLGRTNVQQFRQIGAAPQ